jgi:serine/threonine protein kinase
MDTIRICQQCAQSLPENAPEGLCPACLAKVALGTEPAAAGPRIAPAPADLASHFPQLDILELLGMGGMGIVYKARQPRLDRLVALKILPMESAPHASFAERFNREARALAKLSHPGIVNVYDFGQSGQYYYFVMEYVDGMNLRELMNQKTVTPRQALELVVQICAALQFAHDEEVVHRDIKPENILLNKKGQVKIADFGLAKLLGAVPDTALTMSQAAMGTLNYMAPEQRQNAQGVDHRADIYSLGVVFYEMLTGEVPMGRFEAPSKRVQVDVRLDEVVLKALEREPARRYQQVSEVKTNVENITATAPAAPASPAAQPVALEMAPRPRTRLVTLIKVLSAFLLVGLAVGLLGAKSQSDRIWLLLAAGTVVASIRSLYSRQRIQQARQQGLWPQLGEMATLEHVRRLAQAGEKILAIKLYRQIQRVDLLDAKAAVEQMLGGPTPFPHAQAPPPSPPVGPQPRKEFELFPKEWTVTHAGHSIRVRNSWNRNLKLFVDGVCHASTGRIISLKKSTPLLRYEMASGSSPYIVEVYCRALLEVRVKIVVNGQWVGGDNF